MILCVNKVANQSARKTLVLSGLASQACSCSATRANQMPGSNSPKPVLFRPDSAVSFRCASTSGLLRKIMAPRPPTQKEVRFMAFANELKVKRVGIL